MTNDEKINSLEKNAKTLRETAKRHKRDETQARERAKYWNEAADNAEKEAKELKRIKEEGK